MEAIDVKPHSDQKGWIDTTLGAACELVMGQSPPSSEYNDAGQGLPFFQGKTEFGDMHPTPVKWCTAPTKRAIAGDVLLSVRAPVGPTNLADQECCIGRGLSAVRPLNGTLSKYVLYYLRSIANDIDALGTGTTFKAVSGKVLRDVPFPLAPLPEQRRIVSAIETQLGRLDAAVARLHAAKAKLKRYKQAVLKAAYDEVAEIHEVKTFGELKEFSMYGPRFSSDDYTADGVPVLRTSDIDDRGHVNMSTAPKLSLSKEQIAKYKLKLGDLLVTRTGSIGTVSVFNDSVDAIAGAFLIQYRLGGVDPWYAFHFLRGPVAQHHLIGNIAGIGRPNLNVAAIDSLELPVPPMKEQVSIRKTLEVKLNRIAELDATLDAQLLQATRLRQAVLKRAFEGRLV